MKTFQGAVYGLSLFLLGLCYALPGQAGVLRDAASRTSLPFSQAAFRGGWIGLQEGKPVVQDFQGMQGESTIRAGRLGELWTHMALLGHLEQQKINLQDPVNFYLNDFQLLESHGEIQLRHLLTRQTGLPLRQSNLYLSDPTRIPTLRDVIVQELKPSIHEPGAAITYQSVGDLVGAQLLQELVSQQRNREVKLSEILARHFAPLGWQHTQLMEAKTGAQYVALLGDTAPPFVYFPAVWSTAPAVHGYVTSLADLSRLVASLIKQQPLQKQNLALQGFLPGQVGDVPYYYADSRLFGQFLRVLVIPEQRAGFVLYYNHDDGALAEQVTHGFVTQQLQQVLPVPSEEPTEKASAVADSWIPLRLHMRDQVSVLKVFDVLRPTYLGVSAHGLSYGGQDWELLKGHTYQNAQGAQLYWDGISLRELGAQQAVWQVAKGWHHPWLQWGIALGFMLCFLGFFTAGVYRLWQYEPVVPGGVSEAESAEDTESAWDLPLVATLNSLCVLVCLPLLYSSFVGSQVGAELSLAFRNQPPPLLIGGLVLPLVALISGLIFSFLLLSDWKTRLWKAGQRLLYVSQLALLLMFTVWMASWNLLGFRF